SPSPKPTPSSNVSALTLHDALPISGKVKQMGRPDAKDRMNRPWESGIFKNVADGKRWVRHEGFTDDEVADKKSHGGPHKALFARSEEHPSELQSRFDLVCHLLLQKI